MRKGLSLAAALLSAAVAFGGNTVRITSPLFSFLLVEPDQWRLDLQSAAQIAHFVLTPEGTTWRSAELAIYGRFVPSEPAETLDDFLKADEDRFREQCGDPRVQDLDLELRGAQKFKIRSFICPGNQNDVVAVAQVPDHFAVFILSARSAGRTEDGMDAFRETLEGFRWLGGRQTSRRP